VVYESQSPVRRAVTFCLQLQKVTKKSRGCVYCFKGSDKAWPVLSAINNAERSGTWVYWSGSCMRQRVVSKSVGQTKRRAMEFALWVDPPAGGLS